MAVRGNATPSKQGRRKAVRATSRGKKPNNKLLRERIEVASVAFVEYGLDVDWIASLLSVAPGTVEEYLKDAHRSGLIRQRWELNAQRLVNERREIERKVWRACAVEDRDLAALLGIQTVLVIDSSQSRTQRDLSPDGSCEESPYDARTWDLACKRFGRRCAASLFELVSRARRVGVAWGRTLRSSVEGLRQFVALMNERVNRTIEFFPVWGEILGRVLTSGNGDVFPDYQLSSSAIAADLSVVFGSKERPRSLAAIPALVPSKLMESGEGQQWMAAYMSTVKDYDDIFGIFHGPAKDGALVRNMDCALASVGSSSDPQRFWSKAMLEYAETTVDEMRELVIGDVGGVLLPRADLSMQQRQRFDAIVARWTGIQLDHLALCAAKGHASEQNAMGVIAVGVGRSRAEPLLVAVDLRLVNHLVIDSSLAEGLQTAVTARRRQHTKGRSTANRPRNPR